MKILPLLLLLACAPAMIRTAGAEEFDSRATVGITAGRSVEAAVKRGQKENKRVLVFVVDESKKGQGFHIKGMLEFEETKTLVRDHFLLVVTDFKDKNIRDHVAGESPERPVYVLFNQDGTVAQKGTTAMGGKLGNDLVKSWVAKK